MRGWGNKHAKYHIPYQGPIDRIYQDNFEEDSRIEKKNTSFALFILFWSLLRKLNEHSIDEAQNRSETVYGLQEVRRFSTLSWNMLPRECGIQQYFVTFIWGFLQGQPIMGPPSHKLPIPQGILMGVYRSLIVLNGFPQKTKMRRNKNKSEKGNPKKALYHVHLIYVIHDWWYMDQKMEFASFCRGGWRRQKIAGHHTVDGRNPWIGKKMMTHTVDGSWWLMIVHRHSAAF